MAEVNKQQEIDPKTGWPIVKAERKAPDVVESRSTGKIDPSTGFPIVKVTKVTETVGPKGKDSSWQRGK